jgi:hypothetical protein
VPLLARNKNLRTEALYQIINYNILNYPLGSVMNAEKVELKPETIKEWAAEDLMRGTLSKTLEDASAEQAESMLDEITLTFPGDILNTELVDYNAKLPNPLSLDVPADKDGFNYFLLVVPLNIVLTDKIRMVRLDLRLDMKPEKITKDPVVAYDLFPNDRVDVKEILSGKLSLDVAKALTFVTIPIVGEILNLKLEMPFSWKSKTIQVQCSDRMSNPVRWYVKDESIQNGFTGYVVVRVPKNTDLNINATLAVELRKAGVLGGMQNATYRSTAKVYHIGSG